MALPVPVCGRPWESVRVHVVEAGAMVTCAAPVVAGAATAVIPVGIPVTARETSPVKPPPRVMVTVEGPFAPCARLNEAGAADMLKVGMGLAVTVRASVAEAAVTPEPVARTVRV